MSRAVVDGAVGVGLLAASAVAFLSAPRVLPDSYSWVAHSTSEAAAQGVRGAWLARSGFLCFGFGVLWVVRIVGTEWPPFARVAHAIFAIAMCAVAAFSTRSWVDGANFDKTEDLLHSIGATVMGFAFVAGVVAVAITRDSAQPLTRAIDITAIVAASVLPLAMARFDDFDGLLQRIMFATAYVWYVSELCSPRNLGG